MLFIKNILNRISVLCLFLVLIPASTLGQSSNPMEQRITSLLEKIEKEDRVIEELIDNNLSNLPLGIKKTISGTSITIAIDSGLITPQGILINAYTQIKLPGTNRPISFALKGAVITPSGLSRMGPMRLEVIDEFRIPFNKQVTLVLPSDGRNFIEWDCFGFRSINLSGIFEFSPEFFIPDNLNKNDVVTAGFEINTSDLNNILASITMTPFRIKGLGDMSFTVRNATIDMSDFVNCEGFVLPEGYQNIFEDLPQLWRGFFLKDLSILLPSELSSSGKRTEISAHNLLIDDLGVSGLFAATNVFLLEQGSASGWPFSVKSLKIALIQNRLTKGELTGFIGIPFLGDEPFGYSAQVISTKKELEYNFSISTTGEKEYPIPFGGTVKLDKGCIFRMKTGNGSFIPSAILNGTMNVSAESAKIDGLRFERLHLTAESPYIIGGKFDSFGGTSLSLGGFGLSIDSITLAFRSGKASLGLNAKIALMNRSDKGVCASTRFFVKASVQKEGNNRQKWAYDGILVQGIKVKGNVSVFSLSGSVFMMNDDPVYGDGFVGTVGLTVGNLIKDTAQVEISFGKKTDFKYWFAEIDIPTKIPIGTVTLSSIGGGAYSNMERKNLYSVSSDYLPKKDAGIGLMAQVGLYVKTEKIFNADATFEIAINKSGGVKFIRFAGEGTFFSEEDAKAGKNLAKVTASINMIYDNVNNSFHANLSVYMNIANAIRGIGPGDMLGEAVIHSDPVDWYIYIGRPSCPLGVEILGLLKAQSYFMAGTKIENMPLPPSEVASIISNIDVDFMKNERGVATGRGIAFGVLFKASAGIGRDKGFVYAYLNAGAGADIMLQDYGDASCEGRQGPIGINGWYASGQGYAYLSGKIGVRVKESEFDIMNVAAALLVQAKMPNPSWFRGNIAARYSILGGLIKGKVNVSVVLGEECVLITNGDELGDLKLIGDLSPSDGNIQVDVFAAPQVSFNTTIDKEFGMVNLSDEYAVYRVKLNEFKLLTSDNQIIDGSIKWNPAHDMATLKVPDILPGNKKITATVKVHIEKKNGSVWQELAGDPETRSASFSTGDEPKSIPANNVAYSYPLKNQYNFYKAEYQKGYIKLIYGQPGLFSPESNGTKWVYLARFKNGNQTLDVPVTYNFSESMINYDFPPGIINSSVYEMKIIKKPSSSDAIDRNLTRGDILINVPDPNDSLSVAMSEITGTVSSETETTLHSFDFRTSLYSTFNEKLKHIANWQDQSAVDKKAEKKSYMRQLYIRASMKETFDKYETEGLGSEIGPLVSVEALRGNSWIDSHVYPMIYDLYGTTSLILDRNTNLLGLFPSRAMYISNINTGSYLLEENITEARQGDIYIKYFVPVHVSNDYYELLNKAVSMYLNYPQIPSPQAQRLIGGRLKDISRDNYPFKISYRLPGINTITSTENFVFRY